MVTSQNSWKQEIITRKEEKETGLARQGLEGQCEAPWKHERDYKRKRVGLLQQITAVLSDYLHLETNNSTTLWKLTYDNQLLRHAVVLRYHTPLGLHNRFAPLCYLL